MSVPGTGAVGPGIAGQDTAGRLAAVRHLARHQIMGLTSVFLLGMAASLIGLPAETTGAAHVTSIAFLAAHALIALGLVIGAVMQLRAAARLGGRLRSRAIASATAIAVATAAGRRRKTGRLRAPSLGRSFSRLPAQAPLTSRP